MDYSRLFLRAFLDSTLRYLKTSFLPGKLTSQCLLAAAGLAVAVPDSQISAANNTPATHTVTYDHFSLSIDGQRKFIYSGDTYKGESRITTHGGTATYKYTGKYLGPCDKKKDD